MSSCRKHAIALTAVVAVAAACAGSSDVVEGAAASEAELLHVALQYVKARHSDYDTLLVHPREARYPLVFHGLDWLREEGVAVTAALQHSFEEANPPGATPGNIESRGVATMDPHFVALLGTLSRESWKDLEAQVGGVPAVVAFSGVGVDAEDGVALLYYELRCGPFECVEAHYLEMRRETGRWAVERDLWAWGS